VEIGEGTVYGGWNGGGRDISDQRSAIRRQEEAYHRDSRGAAEGAERKRITTSAGSEAAGTTEEQKEGWGTQGRITGVTDNRRQKLEDGSWKTEDRG
jgi:hypothetical protein